MNESAYKEVIQEIDLNKRYISNATIVINFPCDKEIRYKQREIEKAFADIVGTQFENTNISDDAPEKQYRFKASKNNIYIGVSQSAIQLDTHFFDGPYEDKDYRRLEKIHSYAKKIYSGLKTIVSPNEIGFSGLILKFAYPTDIGKNPVFEYLHDRFVSTPKLGPVTACTISLGWKIDEDHYLHISPSHYILKKGEAPANTKVEINLDEVDIYEQGIEVSLDINNKPKIANKSQTDEINPQSIFELSREYVDDEINKYMGFVNG